MYVWDISLMSGIFVLCLGYQSYVWNISLMSGILVLYLGYSSDVWDISRMSGIRVAAALWRLIGSLSI